MLLLAFIKAFCLLTMLLAFASSVLYKGRDLAAFVRSVESFQLVPEILVAPLAWLFAGTEGSTAILLLAGLIWPDLVILQLSGLLLALVLLGIFTSALISVLVRGLHVPCGCFGTHERPVSALDLVRNAGLMGCAATGLLCVVRVLPSSPLPGLATLVTALMAAAFVLIWTHLDDISILLRTHSV